MSVLCKNKKLTPIIPTTWEAEINRITFQGQVGQKSAKPSQQISWA